MNKDFFLGLAIGMIGGALIITNCRQAKELVETGQKEIKKKIIKAKKNSESENNESEE